VNYILVVGKARKAAGMKRIVITVTLLLAIAPCLVPQESYETIEARRPACIDACVHERLDPDLKRQEVVALEKETARAIQLNNATFFNRVYSDDFSGVLSHGEAADKAKIIAAVQNPEIKYDSFTASNINVRIFRDTAVATCVWSMRAVFRGQRVNSQMLAIHVYVYGPSGYKVVTGQTTLLPPYPEQPL
jgi:hypothetical protein